MPLDIGKSLFKQKKILKKFGGGPSSSLVDERLELKRSLEEKFGNCQMTNIIYFFFHRTQVIFATPGSILDSQLS